MTVLKYIKEIKNSRLLLLGIALEGESAHYTVDFATYEAIGSPSAGEFIDEDQMSNILASDEYIRAKKKALSLLAFADNNRRQLYVKLINAGFGSRLTGDIVDEMVSLGYINEERQLERKILDLANQSLIGPAKIIPKLVSKGYSSSDVRRELNRLVDDGQIDFEKNAARLLEKKLHDLSDSDAIKKLLYNNGYKI